MSDNQGDVYKNSLRSKISLSNSDLYELAYNHQKFMGVVRKFNDEAKNKIDFEVPQDALVYLAEAERILQYAASCGKNIDRNLIICILHNEACCYQKTWDLEKCSNYIQALIYNFHENLESCETTPVSQGNSFYKSNSSISHDYMADLEKKNWNFRLQLSKYQLQFCAINSQLRNHRTALKSGIKAIKILKSIIIELSKIASDYFLPLNKGEFEGDSLSEQTFEDIKSKIKILDGISRLDENFSIAKLNDYFISAKYYLGKWNIRKLEKSNENLKESLKNFSIGSVMQLKPMAFQQNKQSTLDIEKWIQNAYQQKSKTELFRSETYEKIIHKVLLMSMSYFTVATEMRLLANQKFGRSEEAKRQSKQFKQSQIYHLVALILPCIYVPFDMLYIRHILASFNNHNPITIDSALSIPASQQNKIMRKQFDPLGLAECKDFFQKIQSQVIQQKQSIQKQGQKTMKKSKAKRTKSKGNQSQKLSNSIRKKNSKNKKGSLSYENSRKNSLKHSRDKDIPQKNTKGIQAGNRKQKKSRSPSTDFHLKTTSQITGSDKYIGPLNRQKSKEKRHQYFNGIRKNQEHKGPKLRTQQQSREKDHMLVRKKVNEKSSKKPREHQKSRKNSKQKVHGHYKKKIDSYYF